MPPTITIPGLGDVEKDEELDWHESKPLPVAMLGGVLCRIVVEGYDDNPRKEDFHDAIARFLAATPQQLRAATPHVLAYYQDWLRVLGSVTAIPLIDADDLWSHVRLGQAPTFSRGRDGHIYVSLECGCAWEQEHGLQIVWKDGSTVSKVGMFDGHVTNADAYADATLAEVIYVPVRR